MAKSKGDGPALRLLVPDDVLRAIGHVAAQWAMLEIDFDLFLNILLAQPVASELAKNVPQSFAKRADRMEAAAGLVFAEHPNALAVLLKITSDARSLRGKRDDIIHGRWGLHRSGPEERSRIGTAVTVFNQRPKFRVRKMPLSAAQAERVANQISRVTFRLMGFQERVVG